MPWSNPWTDLGTSPCPFSKTNHDYFFFPSSFVFGVTRLLFLILCFPAPFLRNRTVRCGNTGLSPCQGRLPQQSNAPSPAFTMATIEPRLMHLLNNPNASSQADSSPYYPSTELPPLQSFSSFAKASNISLPPLEPDAATSHHEKPASKTIRQIPSLASIREEYNTGGRYSHDGGSGLERSRQQHSGAISLRMLFNNSEINDSSHSLNHILDEVPEAPTAASDDVSNKKRHRAMTVKDDIMHLPQPLKKQKSTQNMMSSQNIMPPIINGLYEPPPNAAVFPPIALEDDGGNDAVAPSSLHTLREFASCSALPIMTNFEALDMPEKSQSPPRRGSMAPTSEAEKPMARIKRKAAKPRKKWSEEETRDLLLGVNRYGVGKWTSILEDSQYKFNGRTAGDLKDRFRTCCPDELRILPSKSKESLNSQMDQPVTSPAEYRPKGKLKKAMLLEDILADPEDSPGYYGRDEAVASAYSTSLAAQCHNDSDSTTKPKKSRAHRKKIEDLQAMGIHGPFKKSHRRERRPFTQQDDDQILEGLQTYGPAWTKIQRDPRFDLSSRQPTDLRDRVRNKYPEMYRQIEEKQVHNKEPSSAGSVAPSHPPLPTRQAPHRRDNVLEPSVSNMMNENNSLMTLEPHLHRRGSREDLMMPKWAGPSASASMGNMGGGFHELPGMESFSRETLDGEVGGMMDISRLLLDG